MILIIIIFQENYRCYHCKNKYATALDAVHHCVATHEDKELAIMTPYDCNGRTCYQSRHFNVKCNTISCEPNDITLQVDYVLHLPRMVLVSTPLKKVSKPGTPYKSVADAKCANTVAQEDVPEEQTLVF